MSNSDGVTVYHKKSDGSRVDDKKKGDGVTAVPEKKSDGVRVHHKKEQ